MISSVYCAHLLQTYSHLGTVSTPQSRSLVVVIAYVNMVIDTSLMRLVHLLKNINVISIWKILSLFFNVVCVC